MASLLPYIKEYIKAGFTIFPLYGGSAEKGCDCGNPKCSAILKHPAVVNYQNSPEWSDEQLEFMESTGQFKQGYGVNTNGFLIVDIDPRNGGLDAVEDLNRHLDMEIRRDCSYVVETGGGGWHCYYSIPKGLSLVSTHEEYKGIDFKSSGYVVGAMSDHVSGRKYIVDHGSPADIEEAPKELIELLKRKNMVRTFTGDSYIDTSADEIAEMLSYIPNDGNTPYDQWVSIGMAIHHTLSGVGFELWEQWSKKSPKHDISHMDTKWHSFGKSANPVTIGTIIHLATSNGWVRKLEFEDPKNFFVGSTKDSENGLALPFDISGVDKLRPTGFVGELVKYINSQCLYPRERLAVAAALNAVGGICGLNYKDELDDITLNTIFLCVAGAGTGKEKVLQVTQDIMRAAGVHPAVHGNIKSEQEITRNLLRHQAAYYIIDEIGYLLQKMVNSRRSGVSYLENVIASIMNIYSKANGYYLISGDLKEEIKKEIVAEIKNIEKNGTEYDKERLATLPNTLKQAEMGIKNPFLSIIGFTTPVSFDSLVNSEFAENGFIARSMIFRETETNPRPKKGTKKRDIPMDILDKISTMAFGSAGGDIKRVEGCGEPVFINTTQEAKEMLSKVQDYFLDWGDIEKERSGLESLCRRGYESVAKISCILGAPAKLRNSEDVRYAFALVRDDIAVKISMAKQNMLCESKHVDDAKEVLFSKIISIVGEEGETLSVIKRRIGRKYEEADISRAVEILKDKGDIEEFEHRPERGRPSTKLRAK